MTTDLSKPTKWIVKNGEESIFSGHRGKRRAIVEVFSKDDCEYLSFKDKKGVILCFNLDKKDTTLSIVPSAKVDIKQTFKTNAKMLSASGTNYCPCNCGCEYVDYAWGSILIDPRTHQLCNHH